MDRRKLIKYSLMGIAGGTLGGSLPSIVKAAGDKLNWGYIGVNGAENWGQLSPNFKACQFGEQQSPINLKSSVTASGLDEISINYRRAPLRIINNGHTIQVNHESGSTITLNGKTFELLQFHFHHPSEHELNSNSYPMEVHLVHQGANGELAVLGIFMERGSSRNNTLESIWSALPENEGPEQIRPEILIDPSSLLPTQKAYFRYNGSLTTPPCSEIVNWVVYKEPIQVSDAQIEKFASVVGMNARPIQSINRRFLLESP